MRREPTGSMSRPRRRRPVLGALALLAWPGVVAAQALYVGAAPAGSTNHEVTLSVTNSDAGTAMENITIGIVEQSNLLTNVRIEPDRTERLAPGETQTLTVRFDIADRAPVGAAAGITFALSAESGVFVDPYPSFEVVIAPDPAVSACVLRDDAPGTIDVENAVDYCDPGRQPWEYDRVAVFFTPARDFREPVDDREPFLWRIVGPRGDTLGQGSSGSFGPRLPDDSTPFARDGSPGRFAAVIDLWDRDDRPDPAESRRGPGTYTVQTAEGEYNSTGVFGTGELSVTRKVLSGPGQDLKVAEWEDDGTFEVASSRLYFQGFVAEQVAGVALPARADLWEGQLTLDPPQVAGTTVTLEGRAWWRSAVRRQGQRVPADEIQEVSSRLTLEFPGELAPGHKEMGTIGVHLTPVAHGELFFTGGMHLMIPTTTRPPDRPLVSGPTPVVWAAYGNTTGPGSGGDPFQRFEFEEPDPLAYGEFWVWPRGPVSRFAGEEAVELDGKLTLLSGKAGQTAGEPGRGLSAHLHDPDTIWVIPVFLTLTDDVTVRNRTLAMRSYGYAIYAARRGTYTEPLPEGGPEAADAPAPGEEQPSDPGNPSNPGDPANPSNRGNPGNPSDAGNPAHPGDANRPGGDPSTRPGTGAVDPAALDPEAADIAPLIREWLAVAEPPENADGASFRYDDWGRRIGSAAPGMGRTVGPQPPPEGGASPVAFAWRQRAGLDSIDHCRLEEYVVARLAVASIAGCAGRYVRTVATPDVSGLRLDEAVARLRGQGLEIEPVLVGPAPSPDRARRVERQDPAAAGRARPGSTVTVWVYGDHQPATVSVPDLGSRTLADAQQLASAAGLALAPSLVGAAPTPELARRVAVQRPAALAEVAPGATVEVGVYGDYVAPGVSVPSLAGRTLAEAQATVRALGLALEPSLVGGAPTEAQAFRINAQEPAPDTQVAPGATVRVDVWGAYAPPPALPTPSAGRSGLPDLHCPAQLANAAFVQQRRMGQTTYTQVSGYHRLEDRHNFECFYADGTNFFRVEWENPAVDPRRYSPFCDEDVIGKEYIDGYYTVLYSRSTRASAGVWWDHSWRRDSTNREKALEVIRGMLRAAEPYAVPCGPAPPAPQPQRDVPGGAGGGTGGARWVLAETQINPRREPTEFVVGVTPNYYSPRFQGSYERWTVTDTGIAFSSRWMDRRNLQIDATLRVGFSSPPAELVPGQTVGLRATFSHQGTVTAGNPVIRFQYSGSGFRLTGDSSFTYAPFAPTFTGASAIAPSFVVPAIGTGELRLEASLWNCGACHVIWIYRARQ